MEFIIGLTRTHKQCDVIMVVVDDLSKVANFVAIKYNDKESDIAQVFIK